MSLEKVKQVKKDRFFRVWDILVYGAVAAVVIVLFTVFVFTGSGGKLAAVNVNYDGKPAFSCDLTDGSYEIFMPENIAVRQEGDILTVMFCIDGGSLSVPEGYNVISVDLARRSVSVTESDCSNRRDCVHTPAMTDTNGIIICTPHRLEIVPVGEESIGGTLPVG